MQRVQGKPIVRARERDVCVHSGEAGKRSPDVRPTGERRAQWGEERQRALLIRQSRLCVCRPDLALCMYPGNNLERWIGNRSWASSSFWQPAASFSHAFSSLPSAITESISSLPTELDLLFSLLFSVMVLAQKEYWKVLPTYLTLVTPR